MQLYNATAYDSFVKNANTTLLYRTSEWELGASYTGSISMNAKSKITKYVGVKAIKSIFGVGIEYVDVTTS